MIDSVITLKAFGQELAVNPALGGSIVGYHVDIDGTSYPILRDAKTAEHVSQVSSFPLVPYSNRIKYGKFGWQDKTIALSLNFPPETGTIHGHGWQMPWQVERKAENELVLSYLHQANDWPFSYRVLQTFTLSESGLTVSMSVENLSNENMPIGLGFHPYFTRTEQCCLSLQAQQMWAVDEQCLPTKLEDVPPELTEHTGTKVNDLVLDNCLTKFGQQATIHWPEWQVETQLNASTLCDFVVVYSPKGESFFCVEPVTHITDAFNLLHQGRLDTGARSLAPHQTMAIEMQLATKKR